VLPPTRLPDPDRTGDRTPGPGRPRGAPVGTRPDRPGARCAGPDGIADPAPASNAVSARTRSAHRHGDPRVEDHRGALRAGPARRIGARRRQKDRPDPKTVAGGAPTVRRWLRPVRRNAPGPATTTYTRWSMTTPGWPTAKVYPLRKAAPAPGSSPAPPRISPRPGSPISNG